MDQKKWRLVLGTLLFALMLGELCLRAYFSFIYVPRYDGWIAPGDVKTGRIIITMVDPKGPATQLKVGDEFVSINDKTIDQDPNIVNLVQKIPPGTTYKMTVRREGKIMSFYLKTVVSKKPIVSNWGKALVFINLFFILVGYGVLILKPDSKQAWLLSLTLCSFSGWHYGGFPFHILGSVVEYLYYLSRIVGIFFIPLFARLFLWFPERSLILQKFPKLDKYLLIPFYILLAPILVSQRLPASLLLIVFRSPSIAWLYNQWWFGPYINTILIAYVLISILFMTINYRGADKNDRERLRIIFVGGSIAALGLLSLCIAFVYRGFTPWPTLRLIVYLIYYIGVPVLPITFAYAILRHKVIPISIIIRRGVRYVLVSKGAATLVFTIIWIVMFTVMDTIYSYFQVSSVKWISALSGIIAILVWNITYSLYQQKVSPVIDRLFFRENYDTREILSRLQQSIAVVKDNSKLMELVGVAIQKALHSNSISFYVREEQSGNFRKNLTIHYNSGNLHYTKNDSIISDGSPILKCLNKSKEISEVDYDTTQHISVESNGHSSNHRRVTSGLSKYRGSLGEDGKSLLVPITTTDIVTGMMILGPRLGDLPYSYDDRQMLKSIAGQMSTALDNIRLIERMIEEERLRREIEAQNEMRAKELEDARILQLSMLPRELPKIPGIEIAAYMKTAAEVGGDYYDFHVAEDGTLTVVVGDATGHGLKAGTVVTATKGLFEAFAGKTDIAEIFQQSSSALKRMNLKSLYMAMTMLKINNRRISIGIAGMPPALIYRASTSIVEVLDLYGVPLGAISDYSYRTKEIAINNGDVILLMTDGLAERFNAENNILGYSEIKHTFASCGNQSPKEIISKLSNKGEEWGGGRPQDDDITFIVLKF